MTQAEMTPGRHAALRPDSPAIIMAATGETVSYGELEDRSRRLDWKGHNSLVI